LFGCATTNSTIHPSNPNIEFTSNNQGLLIRTLDRNVKLFVPNRNLRPVTEINFTNKYS